MKPTAVLMAALAAFLLPVAAVVALAAPEPPVLAPRIAEGALPPLAQRLPEQPLVVPFAELGLEPGRYGGSLRMLASVPKDIRMMVVYGYARLVGYDQSWTLQPDILERYEVEGDRVFTFHLRRGHKWSDGKPFTAEDFRFFWEDVASHPELSPGGPPQFLLAGDKPPKVEILDETTVRFSWDVANHDFLPALAGSRPENIYLPAHYLKPFHPRYAEPAALETLAKSEGQRDWTSLFLNKARAYQNDNPALPSLDPWVLQTPPPSSRFVFVRNPFYHRVDPEGRQLPYIDEVALSVVSAGLIPVKAASGDVDLQARGLSFQNFAVLKQGEQRNGYTVRLWRSARGSEIALFPNLNAEDAAWRELMRKTDFRRALSLAIDRGEVSQVIYFGLAEAGQDTVLPASPLFKPEYASAWTEYDLAAANRLLDGLGLARNGEKGMRRFPDGRTLDLVVETAGEDPTQVDVLQLLRDGWAKIGINLVVKPEQRELFRNRVFAGSTLMSAWTGLENALPNPNTVPRELAPTNQQQLSWPKWGQHHETEGRAGEPVDLPAGEGAARPVRGLGDGGKRGGAGADLARDARPSRRRAVLHRHRPRRAAAGGGQQPAAQRAQGRGLQLGARRLLRRLPPRGLLVRRRRRQLRSAVGACFRRKPSPRLSPSRPDLFRRVHAEGCAPDVAVLLAWMAASRARP